MILFTSGVFQGWKHETFAQCFFDHTWLIQEDLPQSLCNYPWRARRRGRR